MQITRKQDWLLNKPEIKLLFNGRQFRGKQLHVIPDSKIIDTVLALMNTGHPHFAIKSAKEAEHYFWPYDNCCVFKMKANQYRHECTVCHSHILPGTEFIRIRPLKNQSGAWYNIDEKCAYLLADLAQTIMNEFLLAELELHFQKFLLICNYVDRDILRLVKQTYIQVFCH